MRHKTFIPHRILAQTTALSLFLICLSIHASNDSEFWDSISEIQVLSPSNGGAEPVEVLELDGFDDRRQLVINGLLGDSKMVDLSSSVIFDESPKGIVEIDETGRITPVSDGTTMVSITTPNNKKHGSFQITVKNAGHMRRVNFPDEVVPIFTKLGCNGGGCHGKSGGQNGFRLSLLGFEPTEDYEWLVKESRSRRIIPAAPHFSLLLTKATGEVPHGGGKRLEKGSEDYDLLVRWIRQGMDYGKPDDPVVTDIEVFPKERTLERNANQQLVVTAHYSDGSTRDVTRSSLYEANVEDMAKPNENGLVKIADQPGDVAVMVRFQGKVDVFRAMVPLGAPDVKYPEPQNFIDELVFSKLEKMGIPISNPIGDQEFLRRVTLDIAGRLPNLDELNAFEDSNSPDKRSLAIERLLDSEDYAAYFANKWSALLRNKRSNNRDKRGNFAFHRWILSSFHENKPFDQFATELITAQGDIQINPATAWYRQVDQRTEMLEDTAQLFLGTRIQCAQCHHHPFEKWSQKDYYQFSAFFSRVKKRSSFIPGESYIYHQAGKASAVNTKTGKNVEPAPLGSPTLNIAPESDPRIHLAEWMRGPENPFFAKTLVNRYWKHFFGKGLVEPEDDIRETNPPTNPDLMNGLEKYFISTGYDLKALISAICNSKTYQLSSTPNEWNALDRQHFSRYYPKRLPAEVLYDSINTLSGVESNFEGLPQRYKATYLPDNSFNKNSYFLTVFGRPDSDSACECERTADASLAQSLHLINSKELQDKLAKENGRAAHFGSLSPDRDIESIIKIYNTAFSRNPSSGELQIASDYLLKKSKEKDGDQPDRRKAAFEDLIWAIMNTKEFLFNH